MNGFHFLVKLSLQPLSADFNYSRLKKNMNPSLTDSLREVQVRTSYLGFDFILTYVLSEYTCICLVFLVPVSLREVHSAFNGSPFPVFHTRAVAVFSRRPDCGDITTSCESRELLSDTGVKHEARGPNPARHVILCSPWRHERHMITCS